MSDATATPESAGDSRSTRPIHRRGEHAAAILLAARRLIARQGDFTTQDLIKEAGVALKTFYRYFPSKDLLLVTLLGDVIEENAAALEAQAASISDPADRLEFFVTAPLRLIGEGVGNLNPRFVTSEHWRLYQLYPDEIAAATRPFTDLVQRELEAGRESGVLAPRDPERDAWMIATLVMAVFHHYAFDPGGGSPSTAADEIGAFCLAAVGARPKRAGRARRARA